MEWDTQEKLEQRAERVVENTRALMDDLIAVRKWHCLSQVELAERMGVSQSAVSQIERYDANPTISSIERYAIAVGAKVAITVVSDRDGWVPNRKVSLRPAGPVGVKSKKDFASRRKWVTSWSRLEVSEGHAL